VRLKKSVELQRALGFDEWSREANLVVILRAPGPGETAMWHGALHTQDIVLVRCPECEHFGFMDYAGTWSCRLHPKADWDKKNRFWNAFKTLGPWWAELPPY
jgi:hypothetical protein